MPNIIIQFLIPAALVFACLIIYLALFAFRGFLITGAVLGAVGGDSWAFHRYGFNGMPTIIYLLIPAAVILTCVLIYLASTNFRGFVRLGSILAAIAAAGWLINAITPTIGILLVVCFVLRGLRSSTDGSSSFKAFVVHSGVPDISVGEAYMASEADLI
jgi:hypothetical protein